MTQPSPFSRAFVALVVASCAGCFALALPSHAQPQDEAKSSQPVCLTLDLASEEPFSIIVPRDDANNLEASGYKRQPCGAAFGSRRRIIDWRDDICDLASVPLEDVQTSFQAKLRVRPQQLCGMAELIVGQWQRSKSS